ncbi:hypothetical protein FVEN_g9850 [Fusarium venenatum]|uniref:Uncharacterized protein n=1 Tax=Fusarium venenatum TaxID=56646 RepID=A0A2L2T859_9HYPO|nr:uncharacterized protein FVRRES_03596 [Fusarium venenatum]KAG8352192.1 hypothetical protein FVEN_g9850 [Fusarium venenatum]CEI67084.1 unnamed protein product [Fusarium venenatum]
MNSDKRAQSRMARSAFSTDLTSTDGSYVEIHSAPPLSRKEHSGEHNTGSKFAEAMNNPDWRRRRDNYSSYDSVATTGTSTDWYTTGSGEGFQSHTDNDAGTHSKIGRPSSWNFIDSGSHLQSILDSSEVGSRNMPRTGKDQPSMDRHNMHTVVNKNPGYGAHGLCILLRDSELFNAPENIRMLKLTPLVPGEDFSQAGAGQVVMEDGKAYPVARIQPTRGRLPRWKTSDETTDEGYRTESNYSHHESSEAKYQALRSSGADNIEKAREAVFQDPAVANVGNRIDESQEKTTALPYFVSGNSGTKYQLNRKHEAWKKILQKLNGTTTNKNETLDTKRLKKETERRNEEFKRLLKKLRQDRGLETRPSGATPAEERHFQPELSEKPYKVPQQRKDVSQDPEIVSAYTTYPKKKEWSQDSGVCMDRDSLNSGLNPRAREFLSFKSFARESTSSEKYGTSGQEFFQQIGLENSSEESECLVNQPVEVVSTSLNHHMPPMKPDCLDTSQKGNLSPEASWIPFGVQGPVGFDLTSNMLPFSNDPFSFGAYQNPIQNTAPPGLLSSLGLVTPIGKRLPITSFGNQLNLPTANLPFQSCAVAPNPLMGINATPQLPYNPTLGSSEYSACPPPVSKPMFPDPIQQQKYEAYIEWRKANEPGYALACKSRQQRRAQRGSNPLNPTLPHNEVQPV